MSPSQAGGAPASPKFLGPLPAPKRFGLEGGVWYDNTCGVVTCFWDVSHAPFPGAGLQRPPKFWDLLHVCTHYEKYNQIVHGD